MTHAPTIKGKKPTKPKPYFTTTLRLYSEYAVKGISPDYGLKELRNTSAYKKWMLGLLDAYTVSQIDECSDLLSLKLSIPLLPFFIQSRVMRFVRTTFIDQATKSYVMAFKCVSDDDLLFFVALNQVFDKTYFRFYLSSQLKHTAEQAGYVSSTRQREASMLIGRGLACFKTHVKHAFLISNSDFQIQPFTLMSEEDKKSRQEAKDKALREKELKESEAKWKVTYNSLNMHSGVNFTEPPKPTKNTRPNCPWN